MFLNSYEISEPDYDVECPHCHVNDRKMCAIGMKQALCGNCFKWMDIKYVRYRIEHKTIRTRIDKDNDNAALTEP